MNSQIGAFDFGLIRAGLYTLTCVISGATLPVGTVSIDEGAPAQVFEIAAEPMKK